MPERVELLPLEGAAMGPFLLGALAAAGVDAVEREPGVLRIYAHPRLQDWLDDSPWIELALTESAHQEYPEAQLCVPGSYPLDRILELVRDLPRAGRSRAHYPLPQAPPPGAPEVVGFPHTRTAAGTVERRAVRALVRVRVQTEELHEHLVWVGAGFDGAPLRGEALRWESAAIEPARERSVPSAEVIPVLEAEARRVAQELAQEYGVRATARLEAEKARLDRYLQALEGELSSQLPAGPARRLLGARAESLALRETMQGCLPERGPFKRETLLGSGFWPFRRRGALDSLPPDVRLDARRVAWALPPVFERSDLQLAIDRLFEPRLQHLENLLERSPDEQKLLEAARARLEADHRDRLADIERKCRLQVAAQPVLLHALEYQAAAFTLSAEGLGKASLTWDPLLQRWDLVRCPGCGGLAEELWAAEVLGCPACFSRCAGCGAVCAERSAFRACAVCGDPACSTCGLPCAACEGWVCALHAGRCAGCAGARCSACGGACSACGRAACGQHGPRCLLCGRPLCSEHASSCIRCERPLCPEHAERCPCCAAAFCPEHSAVCGLCRQSGCAGCYGEGACETCRGLAAPGEQTLAALKAQLEASSVDVRRLGGWKLGRNNRYRVVTARAWPRAWVFVVDEETGALIHSDSRFAPLG